ncbi:hypothetical protein [Streptomyces fulvoviolaceus]|uniref:hypothetical protein n=1 Tax=Streptomyces fulvoviolaceus TaxID=285535 RepID=UPI0004CB795E|nr:hypothetical protein [Streptomyces fulvoviolaceus]MCT9075043.1 hypothetical protein [Streptomyces fulvoviolaceus]
MPGTVLLLAASPVGKGCLVDAASVLPVLAAVPPAVLSGTDTANVVELADPLEPQAVLTRLRAAAGVPGPLTVFVAGQLVLDRRQHLPHLALARTTTATVRYTALPWHWIREEFRLRPPGTTNLVLDLHADQETWEWLRTNPLDSGRNNVVYGRIAPPPSRRTVAAPAYMKAVATILRSGHRPPLEQLHQLALSRLGSKGAEDLVLGGQMGAPPRAQGVGVPAGAPHGAGVPASTPPRPSYRPATPPPPTPAAPKSAAPTLDLSRPTGPMPDASKPTAPTPAAPTPHAPKPTAADPHADIAAAVQGRRYTEADALATHHELAALRAYGPASEQALHWTEVRADLAMLAGDPVRSCHAWLTLANARLAAGQALDSPSVEAAVDRAHHQWGQITDPARARELGPTIAELRARVPGRKKGALDHVHRHLRQLQIQN